MVAVVTSRTTVTLVSGAARPSTGCVGDAAGDLADPADREYDGGLLGAEPVSTKRGTRLMSAA